MSASPANRSSCARRCPLRSPAVPEAGGGVLSPPSELLVALPLSFGLPLGVAGSWPGPAVRPWAAPSPLFLFPFGALRRAGATPTPRRSLVVSCTMAAPLLFASDHRDAAQQSDDARPAKGPSGFPGSRRRAALASTRMRPRPARSQRGPREDPSARSVRIPHAFPAGIHQRWSERVKKERHRGRTPGETAEENLREPKAAGGKIRGRDPRGPRARPRPIP